MLYVPLLAPTPDLQMRLNRYGRLCKGCKWRKPLPAIGCTISDRGCKSLTMMQNLNAPRRTDVCISKRKASRLVGRSQHNGQKIMGDCQRPQLDAVLGISSQRASVVDIVQPIAGSGLRHCIPCKTA